MDRMNSSRQIVHHDMGLSDPTCALVDQPVTNRKADYLSSSPPYHRILYLNTIGFEAQSLWGRV